MSEGLAPDLADSMLDLIPTTLWAQMHIATPGPDGDINLAFVTDRAEVMFDASVEGVKPLTVQVDWPEPWNDDDQTVSHLSFWTAETGGTFRFSLQLNSPIDFRDGYTPRLRLAVVTTPSLAA